MANRLTQHAAGAINDAYYLGVVVLFRSYPFGVSPAPLRPFFLAAGCAMLNPCALNTETYQALEATGWARGGKSELRRSRGGSLVSDHKDGYVQALRDLKAWHGRQLLRRHSSPAWAASHQDAIELIDNLLIAKNAPIAAVEELASAVPLQSRSGAKH